MPARVADIRCLQAVYPEARVNRRAPEGIRLRDLKLQDSYSDEVADVFLGASGQKELLDKFAHAQKAPGFPGSPAGAASDEPPPYDQAHLCNRP